MQLIMIYALKIEICIYMHYKSWPIEPLLCDWFAPKFSDRYTEPVKYAIYAKFKALVITFLREIIFKLKVMQFFAHYFYIVLIAVKTKFLWIQFWSNPNIELIFFKGLLDHVTVLIGLSVNGKAVAGVIHQPFYNYQVFIITFNSFKQISDLIF
jgi:hypothetical protein